MADASKIIMTGGDSPETPLLGTSVIYFKTDGKLYTKNDSGEESEVGTGASSGLFEVDVDGGMMPVTDLQSDEYYELDVNDDIMPKI
jgi:hypothetical protein